MAHKNHDDGIMFESLDSVIHYPDSEMRPGSRLSTRKSSALLDGIPPTHFLSPSDAVELPPVRAADVVIRQAKVPRTEYRCIKH